jgi:PAS domain S-box-containing protein
MPRWPWVTLAASMLLSGLIVWLHFEQHVAFEREAGQQRHFRLARVDLNRGYRLAVLATDADHAFDRDEGIALIRQAIFEFIDAAGHVRPGDPAVADEFTRLAREFELALAAWRVQQSPATGATMRIAFGRLERQTTLIDAENQHQLDALEATHTRVFLLAVGGASLILLGGVGTIYYAARKAARAEAEHAANEARFRAFFEQVPVPLGFVTYQGEISFGNRALTLLLGYEPDEIRDLEAWWTKVYPDPDYRRHVATAWAAAVAKATETNSAIPPAEFRLRAKDGSDKLVEISGIVVAGGVLAVLRDMTARRQAEEQAASALAERERLLAEAERSRQILLSVVEDQKAAEAALSDREERYRRLVETSFDWVWETDTSCRYTYASPRIKELLGYDPAEVIGRTPFELMPAAEARRIEATFGAIAAERRPIVALENINQHKDGRMIVVETNGVPVFSPDGTWIGYQGMDRDITQRRAAEQMLRLRGAALEAAANAVVILTAQGAIEWVNPAFTKLSGWTLGEAVGQNSRQLLNSGQHDEKFYQEIDATMAAGRLWQGEIINKRKDGALRHEEMTITPIPDRDGAITHFVAIKQDITDRKRDEAQARQAQRMEAIGTLAGGIAHDLNNILAPMLIVAGLIKEQLKDPRDQEMVAMIEQGATRGASIIRQLLTFSRGLGSERVRVQSRHLVREMANIIRETFPREIEFQLDLPGNLDLIEADPTQIHQLLLNLCVNARDAMPEGGRLRLAAANRTISDLDPLLPNGVKAGRFVMMEIADTGHGIPPEIRDRIFDPFFTTKPLGKGTGLGLSTALGIVRSHGGFITVESPPNQGTTFRAFLPAAAAESSPPFAPAASFQSGQSELILVVDDEPNIRQAFQLLLANRGYRVLTAVNGRDALSVYEHHRGEIRLVVTDIMMPTMNGVVLTELLRKSNPDLPIVAMSGMSELVQREELTRLAVTTILQKPVAEGELLKAIEQVLSEPRRSGPNPTPSSP